MKQNVNRENLLKRVLHKEKAEIHEGSSGAPINAEVSRW